MTQVRMRHVETVTNWQEIFLNYTGLWKLTNGMYKRLIDT